MLRRAELHVLDDDAGVAPRHFVDERRREGPLPAHHEADL